MSLETLLDRLVEEPQQFGDWDDVLARAGIRRRRRAAVGAVAVVALLAILFATPALGVLLDLIGRTTVPFRGPSAPARVQRSFFDMSISAPRGLGPDAVASQTREVGTLDGRALYVAPTRKGGFCFEFARAVGGCDATRLQRPLSVGWGMLQRRGGPLLVRSVYGEIRSPAARTLVLEYSDGTSRRLPFIWVTKPIDAGFFLAAVPAAGQAGGRRVTAVAIRDAQGRVLAREQLFTRSRPHVPPHRVVVRPPKPLPAPTAPLQHGSANGVTVTVGANGIAEFHVANPQLRKATWACFKFMRYHRVDPFELGYEPQALHGDRIALGALRGPVDGCEVRPEWGHPWPDPHGYHSGAEIAFTPHAERWFADRAAARKLVLFFRWSRHHRSAPTTGIAVARRRGEIVYSVRSATGKRFAIAVRDGKVVHENVTAYARPL